VLQFREQLHHSFITGEEETTKYAEGAKKEAKLQASTLAYFAHFVVKSDFRAILN
jgi:hypothetical protein